MDVALLMKYANQGMTRQQIAEAVGMSYTRTTTVLREQGIYVPRKKHVMPKRGPRPQTIKIIELRKQGKTLKDISEMLGCRMDTVKAACRNNGLCNKQERMTEEDAAAVISKAGYDYVTGFYNTHSKVVVKCRECGMTFDRMYKNLHAKANGTYQNEMSCPHCSQKKVEEHREKEREQKEKEAEREAQIKAQRKAEQLSRKVSDQLARRLAIHVCKNCGASFCIESTGYNSDAYCSKRCQQRWHDRIKNEKRMNKLNERPHDTDITLEKLFKRDGGVCYICGRSCDWSDIAEKEGTVIAGDNYPSIDHVKPVAKGGTHTWGNIKLACRKCNALKGWK